VYLAAHPFIFIICIIYFIVQEYPWFSSLSDKSKEGEEEEKADDDKVKESTCKPVKPAANAKHIQDPALTASIRELNLRLRRLVHRSLSDIIDPSRFGLLNLWL
jgi:hypothetical protein